MRSNIVDHVLFGVTVVVGGKIDHVQSLYFLKDHSDFGKVWSILPPPPTTPPHLTPSRGRFRTAKSAFKSAFLGTFKSAFTRKSAF